MSPEELRAYHREYYRMHKEAISKQKKARYEANKEQILEKNKEWYEANKERCLEYRKAYYEAHKEEINAYNVAYQKAHPEKYREYYRKCKERKAREETCKILKEHKQALADDPERLSTDFILKLVQGDDA